MAMLQLYGGTDRGLVRKSNEDSIGYVRYDHSPVALAVVADGVGGHEGGEVASKLAIETIDAYVRKAVLRAGSGGGYNDHWLEQTLSAAVEEANQKIVAQRKLQKSLASMATTAVAVLLKEHQLVLANLGDSRCYRWRRQQLELLSHDHTVAQQLIDKGNLNEEQVQHTPYHHVLVRALGLDDAADVDTRSLETEAGDTYLLCSDGLTNCLTDQQIADILASKTDIDACTEELIASANDAGGVDNISVVLVRVVD